MAEDSLPAQSESNCSVDDYAPDELREPYKLSAIPHMESLAEEIEAKLSQLSIPFKEDNDKECTSIVNEFKKLPD